jgi:TetR/AcrR family tetracycline transcriptional repressor
MSKSTKPPRRPARSTGQKSGLSREQIVTESMNLLQAEGLSGLSTRRVAARLHVMSPALYWHVRNKDELLRLVADAICAQMTLPPREWAFRDRLAMIAKEYRRVLTNYRDAARLFAEQPPTGPHRMKLYDAAVGTFLDAGFTTAEAVAMATFYRHYLLGMITEEVRGGQTGTTSRYFPASALGIELEGLENSIGEYPSLASAAKLLGKIQPEELFMAGLKVILDGFEHRRDELSLSKERDRR